MWNVKAGLLAKAYPHVTVLIETLWNVKKESLLFASSPQGINRNIVECKEAKEVDMNEYILSINRNIVECKERCVRAVLYAGPVLIETLWNVK